MTTEPTAEQCSANAPVEALGRSGYAIWYPQMGGYSGKAIVLPDDDEHVDVLVWHNGDFPFSGDSAWPGEPAPSPMRLHHCDPGQFVVFGRTVQGLLGAPSAELDRDQCAAALEQIADHSSADDIRDHLRAVIAALRGDDVLFINGPAQQVMRENL